jgi:hypothetical protein
VTSWVNYTEKRASQELVKETSRHISTYGMTIFPKYNNTYVMCCACHYDVITFYIVESLLQVAEAVK